MQRRAFLGLSAAALTIAAGAAAGWRVLNCAEQPLLLSARDDASGKHYAVGYQLDGAQVFACEVRERCHDVAVHPYLPLALFVGRRPSTESYLIDTRNGRLLQTVHTPSNRHFNGHAVFHSGGAHLYATENDTDQPGRGVIGIFALNGQRLSRIGEQPSHGVGPHQLLWMPDGETLVVANGGIRTEAQSRAEMNLDAMDASLVLMGRDGALHSHEHLPDRQNSVRHLAVARDGTIVSAQQFMGDPQAHVPLLAIKRPGQAFSTFPVGDAQCMAMQQYTASLAIHDELRLLGLTAPRGNRLFIWDLDSAELRLDTPLADCAGIGVVDEGFVVTSGQGRCRMYDCRQQRISVQALQLPAALWDNHLRLA